MRLNHKRFAIRASLLLGCLSLIFAGCGDHSGSGGGGAGTSYQTIGGIASKGPISGATVTVWQLLANGQKGAKLGETSSLSDGSYSLTIPATSGPVVVEVTGNSTAAYLNENNPAGPLVPFGSNDPPFRAAIPDVSTARTVAVTPLTEAAVKVAEQSAQLAGLTEADKIRSANAALSNLLGLDIVATLPNPIHANSPITDINNDRDKYGAYLAGIQKLVTPTNTVTNVVDSLAGKIAVNQALGVAGTNFLSAVNAIISNPGINPTGITTLPNTITIQGAINAPVPIPAATDTVPPSAPSGLSAVLENAKTVRLSWTASTGTDVKGYMVFRNGNAITEVQTTEYFDITGAASTTYYYTVKAFDAIRNISVASNTATITSPAAVGDTTPPSSVLSLAAPLIGNSSVTLIWNASTDNVAVAGYTIIRNSQKIASVSDPGYTDTQVSPNTLYRYQVQAFDAAGNTSAAGNEATVVTLPALSMDVLPPTQPTGLAVAGKTTSSISLSWTASTDNVGVTGYRIYRNTQLLDTVIGPAYSDVTAAAKTTYKYAVEAFDAAGNVSTRSSELTVTTDAVQNAADTLSPTVPAGLASKSVTQNSVNIAWNASTDNDRVAGYNIYRGVDKIATVAQTGYSDTSLTANTLYIYKVNAFDPTGNVSDFSTALSITTLPEPVVVDAQPPTQPTDLAASGITENSISLIWTASTDNIGVVRYDIYRDGNLIGSSTTVGVTDAIGLQPSTTYRYKIKAVDAAGNSSLFSAELSITTLPPSDVTPPTAPAGLSASSVTTDSLTLAWGASVDSVGVVRYDVYRDGVKKGATAGSIRTYSDTNLSPGTTYRYKVQAFDAAGNASPFSAEYAVDTRTTIVVVVGGQIDPGITGLPNLDVTPPTAPTNLSATTFATSAATSSVVLTWNASTDNVGVAGYDVYRNGGKIVTVSQPGYTVLNVPSGTVSDYLVIAFDAAGNRSPVSNQLYVTPNVASLGVTVSGQLGSGITGLPNLDITAPTAPTGLAATTFATSATLSSIVLTWNASTDSVGVTGYEVYSVNSSTGTSTKITTVTQPGLTVTGALSGDTATYFVLAFDAAGNRSVASAQLSVKPNTASLNVTVSGQLGSGITNLPNLDITAPTAPTGLAATTFATSATLSSIVLTWNASTDSVGVTGYEVYSVNSSTGVSTKIATVVQPGLTVTGALSGDTATYFVLAFDAAGNRSVASAQLSVTPNQASLNVTVSGQLGSGITGLPNLDITAPTAPTGLAATTFATSATLSSIVLTWNASTDSVGVTGYEVYSVNSSTGTSTKIATVTQPGLTVTGAPSGTLATYFVLAFDAAGNRSVASSQLSVTPNQASLNVTVSGQLGSGITGLPNLDITAPTAPTSLAATTFATSATLSSIVLTWNASTDSVGVTGYEVYSVNSSTGVSTKIATVVQPGLTVTGALSGDTATYFVLAFDAAGNRSVASSQLSVTPNVASLNVTVSGQLGSGITGLPNLDITAPTAPTGLAATTFATSATLSSIVLTWNASTDSVGVTGYEVYSVNSSTGTSTKIATVTQPGLTVTGAPSGTLATYFVLAFDAAGNRSVASPQLSVTPNVASLNVTVSGQII